MIEFLIAAIICVVLDLLLLVRVLNVPPQWIGCVPSTVCPW